MTVERTPPVALIFSFNSREESTMKISGRQWAMLFAAAGLLCLITTDVSAQVRIRSSVIGSGATVASGGGFGIAGTIGQPVIGRVTGSSGAASQGFWYTYPGAVISGVQIEHTGGTANTLELLPNVPNPFSSSTELRVMLPTSGNVSLKIYDALGREKMTLIDGYHMAGTIRVHLGAEDLESGHYTARLVSGSTVRMIIMQVVK
jgi:hypothetical protein